MQDTPEIVRKLVRVRAGGHHDLVARLIERAADGVVIGSPVNDTHSYLPGLAEPIEVGLVTAEGVVWYAGVVAELESGAEPRLRVRLAENHAGPEQRATPRAPYSLSVDVTTPGSGEPVCGRLIDVSAGGLRVAVPLSLQVGDIVGMTIHVPDGRPIPATARVVHVHLDSAGSGLQFELAVADDRERLVRHAFERLVLVGWRRGAPAGEAS